MAFLVGPMVLPHIYHLIGGCFFWNISRGWFWISDPGLYIEKTVGSCACWACNNILYLFQHQNMHTMCNTFTGWWFVDFPHRCQKNSVNIAIFCTTDKRNQSFPSILNHQVLESCQNSQMSAKSSNTSEKSLPQKWFQKLHLHFFPNSKTCYGVFSPE